MKSITLKLDPLGKHQGKNPEWVIEYMGILPQWAAESLTTGKTFKEGLISGYGQFYFGEMSGGVLSEDGEYNYPKDPTLYPLGMMVHPETGEKVFFYEYSMVGTIDMDGKTWFSRMD